MYQEVMNQNDYPPTCKAIKAIEIMPTALGEIANALNVEVNDYFKLFNEIEKQVSKILSFPPVPQATSQIKEKHPPADFVEAANQHLSDFRAINCRLLGLRNHLDMLV